MRLTDVPIDWQVLVASWCMSELGTSIYGPFPVHAADQGDSGECFLFFVFVLFMLTKRCKAQYMTRMHDKLYDETFIQKSARRTHNTNNVFWYLRRPWCVFSSTLQVCIRLGSEHPGLQEAQSSAHWEASCLGSKPVDGHLRQKLSRSATALLYPDLYHHLPTIPAKTTQTCMNTQTARTTLDQIIYWTKV